MGFESIKNVILITGRPGSGKSYLIRKLSQELEDRGYSVGGMLTTDLRKGKVRVGFEIIDLRSGGRGTLAHVDLRKGPHVGKYGVNLRDLESIGAKSIQEATEYSDVIVIDEIGPMELKSNRFREAVNRALESGKPIIGTIHYRLRYSLIDEIRELKDAKTFILKFESRERVFNEAFETVMATLKGRK